MADYQGTQQEVFLRRERQIKIKSFVKAKKR
jgi:hypothetical protein